MPPTRKGEFFARGSHGKYACSDHTRDVMIATDAADRDFRETDLHDRNIAMFRASPPRLRRRHHEGRT